KRALDTLRPRYDYIIIDCPPALSLLTLNALTAADSVLVPMQCEYYALEGLTSLLQTIDALKQKLNPRLEIEGVLRTMFDVRNNRATAGSAGLVQHSGDKVLRTIVPRNVRLAEAPSHGQSIVGYDRGSRGAIAYLGLAGELIRRQREREQKEKAACPRPRRQPRRRPRPRSAAWAAGWRPCWAARRPRRPRRWRPARATP